MRGIRLPSSLVPSQFALVTAGQLGYDSSRKLHAGAALGDMSDSVPVFSLLPWNRGLMADLSADPFPTTVSGWEGDPLVLAAGATHFGFVLQGPARLECISGSFALCNGMYFAVPGRATLRDGHGLVMTRLGYRGFPHFGGPIEERGRLRYLDGCTDSLLVPPVLRGDPCLNLLHLPPHTRQTMHTHPSLRVGVVVRGVGECVTPEGIRPLQSGHAFLIPAQLQHCFHTAAAELVVIAYHPDSDFGPTDEVHPMINRTILREVQA